jgi:thiamine-phosphate pyrophosphorylase
MKRCQSLPRQWLIADSRLGEHLWAAVRGLPSGSGVLFLYRDLPPGKRARLRARLRHLARARGLVLVDEATGGAARVHNIAEIRRARLAGARIHFLSPLFETRSHPEWKPIPRLRAAALLRLAPLPTVALGGMNEHRFKRTERLGFSGWAGIDAWIRT